MSQGREQYLIEVWNQILQYLYSNRNIEPVILDNFYSTCSLYELTEEKAILLVPNIVSKQIIQSQSDIINAAFIDVLKKDTPMIVEIYQKSDIPPVITPQIGYIPKAITATPSALTGGDGTGFLLRSRPFLAFFPVRDTGQSM